MSVNRTKATLTGRREQPAGASVDTDRMTYSFISKTWCPTAVLLGMATCTVRNPDYIPPGGDPCTMHSQCASQVCLPDNSCSRGLDVAYVDPGGSGTECKQKSPCFSTEAALATGRPYVKMTGITVGKDAMRIPDQTVTILAEPGAKLTRDNPGPLMRIDGNSQVEIFDLEITGATGPAGLGIWMPSDNRAKLSLQRVTLSNNSLAGLSVQESGSVSIAHSIISGNGLTGISGQACTLAVSQSVIRSNVSHGIRVENCAIEISNSVVGNNADQGVSTDGGKATIRQSTIDSNALGGLLIYAPNESRIENNFIVRNGTNSSYNGGVRVTLVMTPPESHTMQFNTVVDNRTDSFGAAGVTCSGKVIAVNNLIFRNTSGLAGNPQVEGDCTYGNSLLIVPPNPGFVSDADYHLTSAAPMGTIRDVVSCAGQVDVDGDSRPQGGSCDLGADEYKAP